MNEQKWRINKINAQRNGEYQEIYQQICGDPVPTLSDDLEMQVKIEQLAINFYLLGYKKARRECQIQMSQLRYQRKVLRERIKGLEKMLEDKHD